MAVGVRPQDDPMRNFKFRVQIDYPPIDNIIDMGFTNVAGINMNTDVVAYREGGFNTNVHKLPGQTDFGPLTLVQGVAQSRPGMWQLAQNMFAVQWGSGSLDIGTQFRFTTTVRVLDHPVTKGSPSGSPGVGGAGLQGARLAFKFYQCWVGSVAFNDLDAAGNAVLISQMTMHHEGFDVFFGEAAVLAA